MRGLLVLVGLVLATRPAFALEPTRHITQYVYRHYEARDGLPHGTANSVAQTANGYLWIGTEEGLVRFDGRDFKVFDHRHADGPPTNVFRALVIDRSDSLWAGTRDRGLLHLVHDRFETVAPEVGSQIRSLAVDTSGDLWVGTRDLGLSRLHDGRVIATLRTRDGLPSDDVRAVAVAGDSIWIGTFAGAARIQGGRVLAPVPELAGVAVYSIAVDRHGGVWFATTNGLAHLHDGTITWVADTKAVEYASVLCDRDGNVWLGTQDGVARIREDAIERLPAVGVVLALFEDARGVLWIGTLKGLDMLATGDVLAYGSAEHLTDNATWSVSEDRDHAMWIGSDDGLFRYADGTSRNVAPDRGVIFAVHIDPSGAVWAGARDGSVGRWRDGRFEWIGRPAWEAIRTIVDADPGLWIGTEHGLFLLRTERVEDAEPILPGKIISALEREPDGTMWVGTEGRGLVRLGPSGLLPVPPGGPPATSSIVSFLTDGDGTLWVGTEGQGLWRLRGGRWSSLSSKDGIFDDVIWRIVDDGHGSLWMSSNRGFWQVRRSALEMRISGGPLVSSTVYGEADGMRDRECNGGIGNAGVQAHDGRLWFPSQKGIVALDPTRLSSTPTPGAIVESVQVDGAFESLDQGLVLPPGSSRLVVRYTAPELDDAERVRYRYRLEGFDADWIDASIERDAQYTNLPPGHYTFVVEAQMRDAYGSAARFEVIQEPHIYQTLWFRAVAVAMVGLMVLAVPLLRVRQLRARTRELDARVEEAVRELKILTGLIPICAWCKKIRDDGNNWDRLEAYISKHTHATFTHGICPECDKKMEEEENAR